MGRCPGRRRRTRSHGSLRGLVLDGLRIANAVHESASTLC
ncbi:hypothetical protein SFR_0921 [Streptomyces sp. FR-008]|nr:hypothetical protein SFR_0921 [Streptomyces sp. FR-008]